MLFKREVLDGIVGGSISLAFRRWRRPTVRTGGQLRTAVGVLAIDAVDVVTLEQITERDARRAGFASRPALVATLEGDGVVYRIALHHAGADPREALRRRARVSEVELAEIARRLARLDASGRHGAWTARILRMIAERPGVRAPDLAASMGRDTASFKIDVRKLKELGLTESLEVGYRLSPRGRTVLAALAHRAT